MRLPSVHEAKQLALLIELSREIEARIRQRDNIIKLLLDEGTIPKTWIDASAVSRAKLYYPPYV